jgi:carbamoyl-phosphate synthase large subunit
MSGKNLAELGFTREVVTRHFSVKEAVFPFVKFPGVDTLLGPEMKSTGEVMGIDSDFGRAYAKAQIEAGNSLPVRGSVLVSARAEDRGAVGQVVRELFHNGFRVLATPGTAAHLDELGVAVEVVPKVGQGPGDVVVRIDKGEVDLVINTVGTEPRAARDSLAMRRAALMRGLPYFTTVAGARAAAGAIRALQLESIGVRSLQEIHGTG